MNPLLVLLGAVALAFAGLIFRSLRKSQRRKQWRSQPLPTEWRPLIETAMPFYARLPADLRTRLDGLIQQFLEEKEFIGCNGLEVTLEMKLAVAAPACLLIVNRTERVYEELYSVLIYPSAFIVPGEEHDEAGVVTTHESVLSGEAWETHRIILSWEDIQKGAEESGAGYNVVLHEFSHYLDAEDGGANGAPWLKNAADYERWSQVFNAEYEQLQAAAERGEETLMDPYGAEDPAEFFAVATETFFELPRAFKEKHPTLYAELAGYYRLQPAEW